MKNTWQEMSNTTKRQELLNYQLIDKMVNKKYVSKMNKIGYSEYAGAVICYLAAVYLIFNFAKIAQPLMQLFTIIALLLLLVLPIISIQSLRNIKNLNISSKTYLEAIEDFGKQKIKFIRLQKLNLSLGLFLITVAIPVLSAIQGKNISQNPNFWTLIFPIAIAFFLVFAFWVLRSYRSVLNETEKMLSEINN
ncbi:MAG: hypothetical protein ACQUHE_17435 [Bacteroidia bacterium]